MELCFDLGIHGFDMTSSKFTQIQSLLWPESGIITEIELFVRLSGTAAHSLTGRNLTFLSGGEATFDTSANLFNLGKWQYHCGEIDIHLGLMGKGTFELKVTQATEKRSYELIYNEIVELAEDNPFRINLTPLVHRSLGGVLFFSVKALSSGNLQDATWETTAVPRRLPQLALSITTFKREKAVQSSVARFENFMSRTSLAPYLHLFVVDNGQSANIQATKYVTPINSENLGGSGGFARGLLAAEERGASHCLFMDDDASVNMEVLERTWHFLSYAVNSNAAVAGSLAMANHRWAVWESGAVFDQICHPQWNATDLRDFDEVLKMEVGSTGRKPHNYYGGWWYFVFPIAHALHRPFPFFVRGDDISFSIANNFEISTLPGVVCFQDADFSSKENLQNLYLDLRSHLAHHLALPSMEIGRKGVFLVGARFFARSMMQCHYESVKALRLAVEDVLRGPEFFTENADFAERRSHIGTMRRIECYTPITGEIVPSRRHFDPRKNTFLRNIMKYSLNGYLLPFFGYWGNSVTLSSFQRGQLNEIWGAASVTYVNSDRSQSFTVRHSKWQATREGIGMLATLIRLIMRYPDLQSRWRKGYDKTTLGDFWLKRLNLPAGKHASDDAIN